MPVNEDADPLLYVVRCNFTDPERAAGWHEFYNEKHAQSLLGVPGFRSLTRFQAVGLDTSVEHMAMWEVDGPQVFESPEYRARSGGQWPEEWRPYVTDWTRSLFQKTFHVGAGE
jgi:hypothetical protein